MPIENDLVLSDCKQGDELIVKRVLGSGLYKKRLREMGFIPNTLLKVIKYAPLKDPIEILVKGAHVTVRVAEASHISVEINKKENNEL